MKEKRFFAPARLPVALLLCCALLLFSAIPVAASSAAGASGGSSDASGASSDTSGASAAEDPESEEGNSILAPPGEGLYRPDYEVQAPSFCLLSMDTGLVVAQRDAGKAYPAASLVKLMTAMLVMEHMQNFGKNLDATTIDTTGKGWVFDALYGMNASTADIRLGEVLSVRQMLYALLLPSANEAAWFLADYVSGGNMTNFMYQMNTRAKTLGCTGTYFDDPNGLSEQNVTTAHDMALIAQAFGSYPALVEIAATGSYELPANTAHQNPYNIFTTNRLMVETSPYYAAYPGVGQAMLAGKTGSLGDWQNFAAIATQDGAGYACVVLQSPHAADTIAPEIEDASPRPGLVEVAELLRWAFRALEVRPALDTAQPVTELRVRYTTETDTVMLLPETDVKTVLPKEGGAEVLKRKYDLPDSVAAPVQAGAVLGSVTLLIGGQAVGSTTLKAQRDIARNETLFVMNKTQDVLTSTFVKVFIAVAAVFALLYAGLFWLAYNSRKRRGRAPAKGKPGGRPSPKR